MPMPTLPFDGLVVAHHDGAARFGQAASGTVWQVRTCQREIRVTFDARASPESRTTAAAEAAAEGIEIRTGESAYRLLLEVATGLRSHVLGETNIAGQLRSAWQTYLGGNAQGASSSGLAAVAQALFADAAIVRQQWLQDIGGTSYGTLARRLLALRAGERVLVVGAGALARSVLPALSAMRVGLFSRSSHGQDLARIHARFGRGEERAAIAWAEHAIFCTPPNNRSDAIWAGLVAIRPTMRVAHLGLQESTGGSWQAVPGLRTLDDLFSLARSQRTVRAKRIAGAREACARLAQERAAGIGHDRRAARA